MTSTMGPTLMFSERIHAEKYRGPGESFEEAMDRVAGALAEDEAHFRRILPILRGMYFLPAGRVQAAVGSPKLVTPYNCYVSATIGDSFVDGKSAIMTVAAEAAQTMRMGGGIGYDFSTIRPSGSLIKKLMSTASGPISFMEIFDAVCKCVQSAGHRRGAQMGVLRVDHPDIEQFVTYKHDLSKLTGFNVSIAITDEFMHAVKNGDKEFELRFEGEVLKVVDPVALWELIMRSTWDYAEPGVLFIDRINNGNNLKYCETIAATNPCGEQPLPPHGACLLGSFNLTKYVRYDEQINAFAFDWDKFKYDIGPVIRMMDNVIDDAIYPLQAQEDEAKNKRRMGIGITGLANAGEAVAGPYGSPNFLRFEENVLEILRDEAYYASAKLAKEKGPFPLYDAEHYTDAPFIQTLPDHVFKAIKKHGIRNSHLLSIAPTGTISMAADNVSSSIEPVFEYEGQRLVNMPEGQITVDVSDYGYRVFGIRGTKSSDVTAEEHLAVLATAQKYVDSACSKTINMDGTMPWEDFKGIYMKAWEMGCKGCTTFNKDGKRMGILLGNTKDDADEEPTGSCEFDPQTGRKSCE